MSKGMGRVQQVIRKMIASEPGGAWTTDDICRRVYLGANSIEKKHRVAVLRALRHPNLAGTWSFKSIGQKGEHCLYDRCDDESQLRVRFIDYTAMAQRLGWPMSDFEQWQQDKHNQNHVREALKSAASSREYRDATPVERLDIDIRNAQTLAHMGFKNIDIEKLKGKREAVVAGTELRRPEGDARSRRGAL